jgi:hypothetical protein
MISINVSAVAKENAPKHGCSEAVLKFIEQWKHPCYPYGFGKVGRGYTYFHFALFVSMVNAAP